MRPVRDVKFGNSFAGGVVMKKSKTRIHAGPILNPLSPDRVHFVKDGGLAFDESGLIVGLGQLSKLRRRFPEATRTDCDEGDVIVPGLIDCHTHFAQYEAAGTNDENLLEWLADSIYPEEAKFQDPSHARRVARKFFRDLVKAGTTTASVFSTIHETATNIAFEEAQRVGIRAIIGKMMMDQNAPEYLLETTEESVRGSIRLCRKWNGRDSGRLHYAFSPRFAPSCSYRLMKSAGLAAARYDAHVQTHLAETKSEMALVHRLFPNSGTYTQLYEKAELVRPKAVFGHGIYLSHSDHEILHRARAGIAHCPSSNLFLRSGLMNFRRATKDGVRVGLGTDIGAGPVPSVLRAMGAAGYVSKVVEMKDGLSGQASSKSTIEPPELLYAATLGGASALGLEAQIGNFGIGKRADFIVLGTDRLYPIPPDHHRIDSSSLMALMAYRGDDSAIMATYVDGKLVYSAR
jgi:guanine deaminase